MSKVTRARRSLSVPSTLLIISGILGVLMLGFYFFMATQPEFVEGMREEQSPGDPDPEFIAMVMQVMCAVGVLFQAFVVFGALKMRQAKSFGISLAAAIVAMIPIGACCLISLPAGIWAIVVMNKPEVKDAFFGIDGPEDDEADSGDELDWSS